MQPEVVKEYSIPITAGDTYVGLVRSVDKNPQMLYDGSTVIRFDIYIYIYTRYFS